MKKTGVVLLPGGQRFAGVAADFTHKAACASIRAQRLKKIRCAARAQGGDPSPRSVFPGVCVSAVCVCMRVFCICMRVCSPRPLRVKHTHPGGQFIGHCWVQPHARPQ